MILKLIWRKRHDFAKCQVASWRSFGLQLSYYQAVTPNWEYCTSRCQHPSLYRVDAAQCIWLEIISLIYTFYKIPSLFAMGKMITNYIENIWQRRAVRASALSPLYCKDVKAVVGLQQFFSAKWTLVSYSQKPLYPLTHTLPLLSWISKLMFSGVTKMLDLGITHPNIG